MQQKNSAERVPFPDGDAWEALVAPTSPSLHVEFFCEPDSNPALMPARAGVMAAGDSFSPGDKALGEWATKIINIAGQLAEGGLVAFDPEGKAIAATKWRGPLVVSRETLPRLHRRPRLRVDRYRIIRDGNNKWLHVSLGADWFASRQVVGDTWGELDGERLPRLRIGSGEHAPAAVEPVVGVAPTSAPLSEGSEPARRERTDDEVLAAAILIRDDYERRGYKIPNSEEIKPLVRAAVPGATCTQVRMVARHADVAKGRQGRGDPWKGKR